MRKMTLSVGLNPHTTMVSRVPIVALERIPPMRHVWISRDPDGYRARLITSGDGSGVIATGVSAEGAREGREVLVVEIQVYEKGDPLSDHLCPLNELE